MLRIIESLVSFFCLFAFARSLGHFPGLLPRRFFLFFFPSHGLELLYPPELISNCQVTARSI